MLRSRIFPHNTEFGDEALIERVLLDARLEESSGQGVTRESSKI